jgi:hypothetical protein
MPSQEQMPNCEHPPGEIVVQVDDGDVILQWCQHCGAIRLIVKGFFKTIGERTRGIPDNYLPWELPKHFLNREDPTTGLTDAEREMAATPGRKIKAIQMLRERTLLGLKEAKERVDAYIATLNTGLF